MMSGGGMDGLELRILGPMEVIREGTAVPVPAARQRDLLAALALSMSRLVPTERLVSVLWGDDPPATARNTLHTLVRRVRRLLATTPDQGARVLRAWPGGYMLELPADRLDAHRFESLVDNGRRALAAGDPEAAVQTLDRALALFRGPALADVPSEELRRVEQPRLAELRLQAEEERIEARLRCGRHAEVVGELRRLVSAQPLRERPYEQLLTALYRCGRRAEALATYQSLRQVLAEQLGVEPGQEVRRLHRAVLRGEPPVEPSRPAAPAERAIAPADRVPAQLPAGVAAFTGRAAQLAELDGLLAGGGRSEGMPAGDAAEGVLADGVAEGLLTDGAAGGPAVVAIVGPAGVGKTALAVHWSHRIRDRFPDGQLHVDLRGYAPGGPMRAADALAIFIRSLGVPADRVPTHPQEAAALYRTLLAERRVLVLLDNARHADQVQLLLPGGRGCLTLVTSRDRLDALAAYDGAARLALPPMAPGESRELLARMIPATPGEDAPAHRAELAELAELCAHLPLALRIAGAGLGLGDGASVAGKVTQLRAGQLDALRLAGDAPGGAVRATFDLSYHLLDEPARRLFRLAGAAPVADLTVPAAAVLAGTDRHGASLLLDRLAAAHVVEEVAPGRYGCHDLLRRYAAELAGGMPGAEQEAVVSALVGWYVAAATGAADVLHPDRLRLPGSAGRPALPGAGDQPYGSDAGQAVAWLDGELHNLVSIARYAASTGHAAGWRLACDLRSHLVQRGHLAELRVIAAAGLAAARASGDPAGRAAAYLALGTADWTRRRHRAAAGHYRRAARLAGEAGWLEGEAAALANLATARQHLGQREEAARCYTQALARYERLSRPEGRAAVLVNLGNTRWELGDLDRAAGHFAEALDLFQATGSRTGPGVTLLNLGNVLVETGRTGEALAHLTEALALHREAGNQVSEAGTLRALAAAYCDDGQLGRAWHLANEALALARQTRHPVYEAAALETLATLLRRSGEVEDALRRYREALATVLRASYPHLEAQIHLGLAGIYHELGRPDLAGSHASRALTLARGHEYRLLERLAMADLAAAGTGLPPASAGKVASGGGGRAKLDNHERPC